MSTHLQSAPGARVTGRTFTGWLGQHPLFAEIQRRPGLLAREVAWRWACGSLLLLLAGFAAWRVWVASLPALQAAGLLLLTPESLSADPAQLAAVLPASFDILQPPLEHTALGLAPLGIFLWVGAFAFGRSWVMAEFDPRLPRRRWLLGKVEALRILGLLGAAFAWVELIRAAHALAFGGGREMILLYLGLVLGITLGASWFTGRFRRAIFIAAALALVEQRRGLLPCMHRALSLDGQTRIVPLRKAVGRVRTYLLIASVMLAFIPAPFHFGWALAAWWLLFSLPPLAAADAWRLGAFFGLVRALEVRDPDASVQGKP